MEKLVKLVALSILNSSHDRAHRLIKCRDIHMKMWRSKLIASSELDDPKALRKKLFDAGVSPKYVQGAWAAIKKEVSRNTKKRVRLSNRPGYVDMGGGEFCYLNTNGDIIGKYKGVSPMPHPDTKAFLDNERASGTLEEWQEHVAALARHSPFMMLALCSAFSGYCIRFTDIETGGFHFHASSSKGKSTTLLVAASVRGKQDLIKNWNMTETAFEEIAEASNDSVLLLDELKLLDRNPDEARRKVQHLTYMLGAGGGKHRSNAYQQSQSVWRLVALSTGEFGLGQHAPDSDTGRLDGERVRFVDVEADAGAGMGVFSSLPDGYTPSGLAEALQAGCSQFFGTAGPVFLSQLLMKPTDRIKKSLSREIKVFLKLVGVETDNGVAMRIARRFALVYASGSIASKYNVLPFSKDDISTAISYCYHRAVQQKLSPGLVFSSTFIDALKDNPVRLSDATNMSLDELNNEAVILTTINDEPVYAIHTDFLSNHISCSLRSLVKRLELAGILVPAADKKNTRAVPFRGKNLKRRYCLRGEKIADIEKLA